MKIIYHCYGGSHSSVTAASIHLGLLPVDRVPSREMFWKLPLFDRQEADQHGHIYYMGTDEYGHEVYLSAHRSRPQLLEKIFRNLADIYAIPRDEYLLIDVMGNVNLAMKFGGFLSRRWGFISLGRPIVTMGTQVAYFRVVNLVQRVKGMVKEGRNENSLFQRQQVSAGGAGRSDPHGQAAGGRAAGPGPVMGPAVFEYKRRGRDNNFPGGGRFQE
jgi:hypothetical protein